MIKIKQKNIRGIFPIIYSFFNKDNTIDHKLMIDQLSVIKKMNPNGIACLGLATEVNKLTFKEKKFIIELIRKETSADLPLAITIKGNNLKEYKNLINISKSNKADWIILQPLIKKNTNNKDCYEFFSNLLHHTGDTLVGIQNAKEYIGVGLNKGKINKYFANNEIILTAGAYISPKILMLSGVGDENELSKHNIKTICNLKGVGKNLQDHHEVPFVAETKSGYGYFKQDKGIRMLINGLQYMLFNSGPVTSNAAETCSFLNPRDLSDDKEPPIKLYCVQIMYTDRDTKDINPTHGLTLTSCIMNPKARGEVTLKSSNPLDRPLINPNFFSNEDDLNLLMDSVKFARTVIDTNPLKEIVIKEVLPGTKINTDNELRDYCKRTVKTNWHPVGTCKMGLETDKFAVLDSKLRVHGLKNLRVFDVSMMPSLVSANTNAPAMAIADRATDMMLN